MTAKLHQKIILITGAARGIGLGCALACLRHGARVALLDLQAGPAKPALAAAGFADDDKFLLLDCDVRDENSFKRAIQLTVERFGRLDGIVNNAGWHPPAMTIEETSCADFESLLRLNLTSTFLGCKLAVPHLKKTRGAIVNMASAVGLIGQKHAPSYVATKAGQIGLTKALALDLAPDGVRVNAICPAGVMTPLLREWAATLPDPASALKLVDSFHPMGRMATSDEMGEVCAFLLSAEASFVTGQAIAPDGGAMLGYRA